VRLRVVMTRWRRWEDSAKIDMHTPSENTGVRGALCDVPFYLLDLRLSIEVLSRSVQW
jgi:hypothetical protein